MEHLIKPENGSLKFSLKKTTWLYLMIIPCVFINFNQLDRWTIIIGLILTFITVCLGHSIGLHRGVIHKSYRTTINTRNVLVYFFVLTGLGGPISWIKLHYYRDYWQSRKDCPKYFAYEHTIIKDYWWNLHLTFIPGNISKYQIPLGDLNNKWFLWLEKTWYLHTILLAILIYLLTDLNTMLFLVFFRSSMIIIGHWYIGYASHKYGYSHFEIQAAKESAFNDVFLGLISFGEGYHNNHHAHPSSANFGVKWFEFDLGWQTLKLLRKLRVISAVKNHKLNNTLKNTAKKRKHVLYKLPF